MPGFIVSGYFSTGFFLADFQKKPFQHFLHSHSRFNNFKLYELNFHNLNALSPKNLTTKHHNRPHSFMNFNFSLHSSWRSITTHFSLILPFWPPKAMHLGRRWSSFMTSFYVSLCNSRLSNILRSIQIHYPERENKLKKLWIRRRYWAPRAGFSDQFLSLLGFFLFRLRLTGFAIFFVHWT